ncbi:MAG: RnfABCDGE type electron transport complex subunit G [Clostridia bacterium]|nr:RnfABCDGE type electron transport complex subunit G [Clostridia bacterium]MBQ2326426.1 RnfABCDGE type electron transport complex subunit G [Clostridia bacterium]
MKNNEYIRLGGVLLAITSVVALLLGFFNDATADIIAATNAEKQNQTMHAILSDAASFGHAGVLSPEGSDIAAAHKGYDKSAGIVGWCFTVTPRGYGGELTVMVGVSADLKITGVEITNHSETPGLGAKAVQEGWRSQFIGKSGELTVTKSTPSDSQIQAITSATITSKAVTSAVNESLAFAQILAEKEGLVK